MGSAPGSALGVEDSGLLSPQSESADEAEKAGPPHSSFQTDHLEENFAGRMVSVDQLAGICQRCRFQTKGNENNSS